MDEMKKPLVSVLLCVYNEKDWIEKCVESILKQTYSNFEFIIVDDGSKDETLKILRQLEKKDFRIQVFSKKNSGLTKSLNYGISKCSGKYIARIDADNLAHSSRLEKQVSFLEKNSHYGLVGSFREDVFLASNSTRILKLPISNKAIQKGLMRACVISHSSVIIRADILKQYKYNEKFRTSQDYELWMRMGKKYKFHNIPEVLSHAYYRENSITRTKSKFRAMKLHMKIKWLGYKNLKRPMWEVIYIIKPMIEFIVPEKIIQTYVNWKLK